MMKILETILKFACCSAFFGGTVLATPLTLQVYQPQAGIFPVTSTLISGSQEAVLVDAQFSIKDGEQLVQLVRQSGKRLTTILITCGDPDYYFGLQPLVAAFPQAKIIASPSVVAHIQATKDAKLAYWGPILKEGAPTQLYLPQASELQQLQIDGEALEWHQDGHYGAFLWLPQLRTVLGGVGVASGQHVWTADTQTLAARAQWLEDLQAMLALHPQQVIPGHFVGEMPKGTAAIEFTATYLQDFQQILQQHQDSAAVVAAMKKRYPGLSGEDSLDLSAKVNTGEIRWP